jgi:hypothetical protein
LPIATVRSARAGRRYRQDAIATMLGTINNAVDLVNQNLGETLVETAAR